MAYLSYLTTTATVHLEDDSRSLGGGITGDRWTQALASIQCSQPINLDATKGETLGRDGLILDTKIFIAGPIPTLGGGFPPLGPGYQLRVNGRRFDVDSVIDEVGFGRIIKILCKEVKA